MTSFKKDLPNLEATRHLAQSLAMALLAHKAKFGALPVRALFFKGDLGSGKTTFTRALVEALPGGENAEVSSPSFTLCNAYTTTPRILHADLYRCMYSLPEDVWEALDNSDTLSVIEWSEYMPKDAMPEDYLDISLKICQESRLVEVHAFGPLATELLTHWPEA